MSSEKNKFEGDRWISQAAEDLEAASVLFDGEKYAQACFYYQQSAEKAVKGVARRNGWDLWGHSLLRLCGELKANGLNVEGLQQSDLALLDRFYIPTRYPNGLPEIIPQQGYHRGDAETARKAARRVVKWAQERE